MGNYQGKATGKYDWGQTQGKNGKKPTPYVAVDVQLIGADGQPAHVLTKKFFFVEDSEQNMRISIENLQLLGARILQGDITDLHGLGSTMVGIVTEHTQYGEEIKYINPPGPRGVKEEEKMDAGSLAAFRARMMGRVAGIMATKGGAPAPQTAARAPYQGQQRPQAPQGAQPWDQRPAPQQFAGPPANHAGHGADDGDPWNQSDAYEGVDQPSQLQQHGGHAPSQAAPNGPPQPRRAAPF